VGIMQDIYQAVVEGRVDDIPGGVESALSSGVEADDILNKALVPAMDLVGEKFGEGEYFIPQVLWSAKAMHAAMELLRPLFAEGGDADKGRIIIGTAKGDIHDIGKNLVGMMLEGAGFKVVDLGVDVAPERFVETAVDQNGRVIAISALLTTTMPAMGDVISLVRERNLSTKVLIGGAPVDEAFCREIGADGYGVDAVDAVRKVRELLTA
jgi:5-methyltetrahydrofolate--homocysteine methyltransferase